MKYLFDCDCFNCVIIQFAKIVILSHNSKNAVMCVRARVDFLVTVRIMMLLCLFGVTN
jgi:hypothetical protein